MKRVIISLPQVFDLAAASSLKADLTAALCTGAGVTIEAGAVVRVGTAGLQVLLSAARRSATDKHDILINETSEALRAALGSAGIVLPNDLNSETRLLDA